MGSTIVAILGNTICSCIMKAPGWMGSGHLALATHPILQTGNTEVPRVRNSQGHRFFPCAY